MAQDATLVDVNEDLSVKVRRPDGTTELVALMGVDVAADSADRESIVARARGMLREALGEKGMRVVADGLVRDAEGRRLVYLEYYAWQDKSGKVWRDAGEQLVAMGLFPVASGQSFERKQAYEKAEKAARSKGFGRWKP